MTSQHMANASSGPGKGADAPGAGADAPGAGADALPLASWADCMAQLVAVAGGRAPADLVVTNCRLVNVHSREILDGWQIAIAGGRFAYVGPDAGHCTGPATQRVDAGNRYVIPGLCDGHMHIESGLLTPAEFAAAVAPHGTTSIFADPHEIANVLGLDGVRMMHDEAVMQPINIFMQMPSCAPSAPGLETTGHALGPQEVAEAMTWPGIVGLGEMMNFPGVIRGDAQMHDEMALAMRAGKTVGGHYASPDLGPAFHAYVAGGAADDHEGTRLIDAVARVRQGMRAMLRLGSAWHDVERQIAAITQEGLDSRNFILCTDDCHSGTLVHDGHMNRVVRHAVACGADPLTALQMASLNTATHFGLERELGSIAPGRRADFIITSDLVSLPIESVWARGTEIARKGQLLARCPHYSWPDEARATVRLAGTVRAEDFAIRTTGGAAMVEANVIGVIENQAPTEALRATLPVRGGMAECAGDVCHVAVVERHRASGKISNGFVSGFGYRGRMAVASTIAHDSHHIIVVGTDRDLMARAVNRLGETGGGITVWRDDAEQASVALPIAGLMSDKPAGEVAAGAAHVGAALEKCGCRMENAIMQHSLLALVVIPQLRISDLGLVDVLKGQFVPVLASRGSPV